LVAKVGRLRSPAWSAGFYAVWVSSTRPSVAPLARCFESGAEQHRIAQGQKGIVAPQGKTSDSAALSLQARTQEIGVLGWQMPNDQPDDAPSRR
jgi:hypothetical protein